MTVFIIGLLVGTVAGFALVRYGWPRLKSAISRMVGADYE